VPTPRLPRRHHGQKQNGLAFRPGGRGYVPTRLSIQTEHYHWSVVSDEYSGELIRLTFAVLLADENPLAGFKFGRLPTEPLVNIFRHARTDSALNAYIDTFRYPVALSQVCRYWRTVVLGAPTLWANIDVPEYHTEEAKEAARIYLERSKTCPIFLTWFTEEENFHTDVPAVVQNIIIPGAKRWQRITLFAGNRKVPDSLLAAMESLNFPILQDLEISCKPFLDSYSPKSTLRPTAPLLRRCRLRDISSLPPPSNLVVLDYVFLESGWLSDSFNLDPLLEFLPHVAHSLEHLRCGPPPISRVHFTPRVSKIPLENLKSIHTMESHAIMDHILAPNLTYFAASYPPIADAVWVAGVFEGFSAPKMRSIRFRRAPLIPLLTTHHLPSMFPQLESVLFYDCPGELAFVPLLEPPKPKKPSSLKKASKHPPKLRKVENPFPHLKELTISDMTIWPFLQAVIEKRLKNGDKSLRKIQLPKGTMGNTVVSNLRRWLPAHGIELASYYPEELPKSAPEFLDKFCDEDNDLFELVSGV